MSFVHIVTSILVNDSFFVSIIQILQVRSFIISPLTTVLYIYRKGPFLSFSQGPYTTLMRPCAFTTRNWWFAVSHLVGAVMGGG